MDKYNKTTLRLLKARLFKTLTQHWFVERTYKKRYLSKTNFQRDKILDRQPIIVYNSKTKSIQPEESPPLLVSSRSRRKITKPAFSASLVIITNYEKIGQGIAGQVWACNSCVSNMNYIFSLANFLNIKNLERLIKEQRTCRCSGINIISACPPQYFTSIFPDKKGKNIRTNFALIDQIYTSRSFLNWIFYSLINIKTIDLKKELLFGQGDRHTNISPTPKSYSHKSRLVNVCKLIYFLLGEDRAIKFIDYLLPDINRDIDKNLGPLPTPLYGEELNYDLGPPEIPVTGRLRAQPLTTDDMIAQITTAVAPEEPILWNIPEVERPNQ